MIALVLLAALTAARVDALAKDALAAGAPGVQVAVLQHGKVLVDRGYGLADLELGVPLRAEMPLRIASITKQFTAAAVLRLVEQGKLTLDTPLSDVLPDFPLQGRVVTIRQLLSHTSGIPSYTALPDFWTRDAWLPLTPQQVVALFAGKPFDFEPGTAFRYSNSGYHLLGLVVEKVTGKPWADAVRELAIAPAGLARTAFCDERALLRGRVAGYEHDGDKLQNAAPLHMAIPFSAGSLCSTALEVARFADALAAGKVVSRASYAQMITPVKSDYGFGLAVAPFEGHRRVGHGGGINGFSSQAARYPDDGLTIAVLVNADVGADLLEQRIARAALGLPDRIVRDLPVPAEEQALFAGTYLFGSTRWELRFEGGKAYGAGERLLYQGHGVFAARGSADLLRVDVDKGKAVSVSLGDGTRWGLTAPRAQ